MFPVRLSKLIREDSDLDPRSVCKQGEDELLNRLQLELNELRSPTWKKLKTTLEAEAISKVHIKRILNEFYSLADEFAVSAGQPASETATILFHLYFRKMKLKNKKSVHLIENYLFGADSSVISHRATKLMREITETLNSYTISSLDKDAVFDNDMFGCKLPYISLKRGGTFPFDTSDLCPMELQSASSDSEDSEEADHQSTAQLETPQLPEMVSPSRKRHVGIKELMVETGLVSLGRHLDSFALGLLPALSSSGDNLVIPVPFNQNKFHLALVAALTFFKSRQISRKNFSSNAKVLYLTSAAGLARGLAWDLEQCLTAIRIKTHCLVGRHSFTKSNVNGAHILVSTFKQWELFTRSRGSEYLCSSVQLLIVDSLNFLEDDCGAQLETVVMRMKFQETSSQLRFLGLLMVPSSSVRLPSFQSMAKFMNASSETSYSTLSRGPNPKISLIQLTRDEEADTVCQNVVCWARRKYLKEVLFQVTGGEVWNKNVCIYPSVPFPDTRSGMRCVLRPFLKTNSDEDEMNDGEGGIIKDGKVVIFVRSGPEAIRVSAQLYHAVGRNGCGPERTDLPQGDSEWCSLLLESGFLILTSQEKNKSSLHLWQALISEEYQVLVVPVSLLSEVTPTVCCVVIMHLPAAACVDQALRIQAIVSFEETHQYEDENCNLVNVNKSMVSGMAAVCVAKPAYVTVLCKSDGSNWLYEWLEEYGPVESRLEDCLVDVLNTEVASGRIQSVEEAVSWFKGSYLYQRMCHYSQEKSSSEELEESVLAMVQSSVSVLQRVGLLQNAGSTRFKATELGHIASSCSINHIMMTHLRNICKNTEDVSSELDSILASSPTGLSQQKRDLTRAIFLLALYRRDAAVAMKSLQVSLMLREECLEAPREKEPFFKVTSFSQPVCRRLFLITVCATPEFSWTDSKKVLETLWIWIEEKARNYIHAYKRMSLSKEQVESKSCLRAVFLVNITDLSQHDLTVRLLSASHRGRQLTQKLSLDKLVVPHSSPLYTELISGLQRLPVCALGDASLQALYSFHRWDPVLSQVFFSLYHCNHNILLAGRLLEQQKILAAELAIFHALQSFPGTVVVYSCTNKLQVCSRQQYWQERLPWNVVTVTENITENDVLYEEADIIVTHRHDWELALRNKYMQTWIASGHVSLLILDDINMMDVAAEMIVSRMVSLVGSRVRLVGLSSYLLESAYDVADFLNVSPSSASLYQFRNSASNSTTCPSVVTVGFSDESYASRSRVMDRVVWDMIQKHCPTGHSAIVVVPSRKQLLKTAVFLLTKLNSVNQEQTWLNSHIDQIPVVQDKILQGTLPFGIGLYHDYLCKEDLLVVENLQKNCTIQTVIVTADVATRLVFPCHLLVVKGTEQFDEDLEMFADYPLTDLSRMILQSDASCTVCKNHTVVVLTHDSIGDVLESFFRGSLVVESSLLECLPDCLNIEVAARTVQSVEAAEEFVSHTYLARRLVSSPMFYGDNSDVTNVSLLTSKALQYLVHTQCIRWEKDSQEIQPTILSKMAVRFKVSQNTLRLYCSRITSDTNCKEFVQIICESQELRRIVSTTGCVSSDLIRSRSSLKVFQVLQHYFSKTSECTPQMERVVEMARSLVRIIVVLCASQGWLASTLHSQMLLQMLTVGSQSPLLTLPHISRLLIPHLKSKGMGTLPQMVTSCRDNFRALYGALSWNLRKGCIIRLYKYLNTLPLLYVSLTIYLPPVGWCEMKAFSQQGPCSGSRVLLTAGQEYFLNVALCVDTPSVWTLVLGQAESRDVVAYRQFRGHLQTLQNVELAFTAPSSSCTTSYTLYILSNSYLGLDQQYELYFKITDA